MSNGLKEEEIDINFTNEEIETEEDIDTIKKLESKLKGKLQTREDRVEEQLRRLGLI